MLLKYLIVREFLFIKRKKNLEYNIIILKEFFIDSILNF